MEIRCKDTRVPFLFLPDPIKFKAAFRQTQTGSAQAGPTVSAMPGAARHVSHLSTEAWEGLEELQSVRLGWMHTFTPSLNRSQLLQTGLTGSLAEVVDPDRKFIC